MPAFRLCEATPEPKVQFDRPSSAVGWPVWIVRIAKQQSSLYKKLHGIVANRFAGVGRVANPVGLGDKINDWRDAA
jgi:hypothetical protein